jgi:hypothetical protein
MTNHLVVALIGFHPDLKVTVGRKLDRHVGQGPEGVEQTLRGDSD